MLWNTLKPQWSNLLWKSIWLNLKKIIEYSFNDKHILSLALTHSSYANEHKLGKFEYNERLEFLGDAVLEFW